MQRSGPSPWVSAGMLLAVASASTSGGKPAGKLGFTLDHNVPGSWNAWLAAERPIRKLKDQKKPSDTDR